MSAQSFSPGSSNIASVSYDPDSEEMRVTFASGDTYRYLNVPYATYKAFSGAPSAGSFFYRQIRDRFSYERM